MIELCDIADDLQCRRCGRRVSNRHVKANCIAACSAPALARPGTELKALLAKIGITASPDCKCNSRAAYMDQMGCDWCEANIEEIVGWLRESAQERGLPFLDVAGRVLVRRAIANARRKEQARAKEAQAEGGAAG